MSLWIIKVLTASVHIDHRPYRFTWPQSSKSDTFRLSHERNGFKHCSERVKTKPSRTSLQDVDHLTGPDDGHIEKHQSNIYRSALSFSLWFLCDICISMRLAYAYMKSRAAVVLGVNNSHSSEVHLLRSHAKRKDTSRLTLNRYTDRH